jgi:hypothetical protein
MNEVSCLWLQVENPRWVFWSLRIELLNSKGTLGEQTSCNKEWIILIKDWQWKNSHQFDCNVFVSLVSHSVSYIFIDVFLCVRIVYNGIRDISLGSLLVVVLVDHKNSRACFRCSVSHQGPTSAQPWFQFFRHISLNFILNIQIELTNQNLVKALF